MTRIFWDTNLFIYLFEDKVGSPSESSHCGSLTKCHEEGCLGSFALSRLAAPLCCLPGG